MNDPLTFVLLALLGVIVAAIGTLMGLGGAFILMPVLLFLYPGEDPESLTSISLAVVFANALSGTIAYARMRRIDYRSAIFFSVAVIPGAVLGAVSSSYISRPLFQLSFGVLMLGTSVFLLFKNHPAEGPADAAGPLDPRTEEIRLRSALTAGTVLSVFVGYISSLLGIGGGIIHVPAMIHLLRFPVHIATATSQFVLAVMGLTGTLVHVTTGTLSATAVRLIPLSVGALIGAQVGARFSRSIHGSWIVRGLAFALALAGLRLLFSAGG